MRLLFSSHSAGRAAAVSSVPVPLVAGLQAFKLEHALDVCQLDTIIRSWRTMLVDDIHAHWCRFNFLRSKVLSWSSVSCLLFQSMWSPIGLGFHDLPSEELTSTSTFCRSCPLQHHVCGDRLLKSRAQLMFGSQSHGSLPVAVDVDCPEFSRGTVSATTVVI